MLSITKISAQKGRASSKGYGSYLDAAQEEHANAFEEYARAKELGGPAPFWFGAACAELGVVGQASSEQVDALCEGFDPKTLKPLVKGAGAAHVVGVDMTFSAPKDVSVLFAAASDKQREHISKALQDATRSALEYAQSVAVTRHGKGGAC